MSDELDLLLKNGTLVPPNDQAVHSHIHIYIHTNFGSSALHRLNSSSSHVLTATSLSYGKANNLTPTESKPLI